MKYVDKYIGWIGNIFLVIGYLAVGEKSAWGFLSVAIGELMWVYKTYRMRHWDMIFICLVFMVIALINLFRWLLYY
jgi:hypothetical protein